MRIDVKLSAEDAAAFNRIVETTGRSKAASIRLWIRADDPGKHRVKTGKPSRAREKTPFSVLKNKNIIQPLLSPRGYDDHPFFNDPAFKSAWDLYAEGREEMGKKISRAAYLALIAQCEKMGLDDSLVALSNSTQGQYVRLLAPPDPKEKPRWAESEEDRECRELRERVEADRRENSKRSELSGR